MHEQISKYEKVLEWLNNESKHVQNDAQILSFIARAFYFVGKLYADSPNPIVIYGKTKELVDEIMKLKDPDEPHFGKTKSIHRAYFALKAIKEIDGRIDEQYRDTIYWLLRNENKKGGWASNLVGDSDVETTSTGIQLISLFLEENWVSEQKKMCIKLVSNGFDRLEYLKKGKQAWSSEPGQHLDVHATSHAIRGIVSSIHYINEKDKAINMINDALNWLTETQLIFSKNGNAGGGWGTNEKAKQPNISDTALGLIALNCIYNFDRKIVSPFSKIIIDAVSYLWNNFQKDHWDVESPTAGVYNVDSIHFTSLIARELAKIDYDLQNIPYYVVAAGVLENNPQHSNKLFIILRLTGLFALIYLIGAIINEVIPEHLRKIELFDKYFQDKPFYLGTIFCAFNWFIVFLRDRKFKRSHLKTISTFFKKYLF